MAWWKLGRSRRAVLAAMFADHRPSFLIDTVVEGWLGTAVADDKASPAVAMLRYADIVVFGGDAADPMARELAEQLPVERAVLPSPQPWMELLAEVHGNRLLPIDRHAFTDESLNPDHLRALARQVPDGLEVRRIDLPLARRIAADPSLLSPDHVCNFDSPQDFVDRGIGFCMLKDGAIVAGASSYAVCNRGIEIQVNTHEAFRGRGLATVASATLIAHTLESGLAAHWDAANVISSHLAQKLGYTPAGTYQVWVRIPDDA